MANSPSGAASEWIYDVSEADFPRVVIEGSRERPIVVDFWAPWCGPCRALGPLLEKAVAARGGAIHMAKVNVDEAQDLAMQFRIEGIPAVKAFKNGEVALEFVGLLSESQLSGFFDKLVPSAADGLVAEAAALEATQPAQAEALYRKALASDAKHVLATIGLARLLIAQGKEAEGGELLEGLDPGGEHGAEAERVRKLLVLRQKARDFGDEAAARARVAAAPANAEHQYELGVILAAAGRFEEALQTLLTAAEADRELATGKVKEAMVQVFHIIGVRSDMADEYRDRLTKLLY